MSRKHTVIAALSLLCVLVLVSLAIKNRPMKQEDAASESSNTTVLPPPVQRTDPPPALPLPTTTGTLLPVEPKNSEAPANNIPAQSAEARRQVWGTLQSLQGDELILKINVFNASGQPEAAEKVVLINNETEFVEVKFTSNGGVERNPSNRSMLKVGQTINANIPDSDEARPLAATIEMDNRSLSGSGS